MKQKIKYDPNKELVYAISLGNYNKVIEALNNGASINFPIIEKNNQPKTPLEWCIRHQRWKMAKFLVAQGGNLNTGEKTIDDVVAGSTILHTLIETGQTDLFKSIFLNNKENKIMTFSDPNRFLATSLISKNPFNQFTILFDFFTQTLKNKKENLIDKNLFLTTVERGGLEKTKNLMDFIGDETIELFNFNENTHFSSKDKETSNLVKERILAIKITKEHNSLQKILKYSTEKNKKQKI
jgi:hypothetical protein